MRRVGRRADLQPGHVLELHHRAARIGEVAEADLEEAQALEVVLLELDADLAADRPVEHLVGVAEGADDPGQVERALARVDAGEERVAGEREVDHPAARPGEDRAVVAELPRGEYLDPDLAAGALLDELRELHERDVLRVGVGLGVGEAEPRFLGAQTAPDAARRNPTTNAEDPASHPRLLVVRPAATAGAAMLSHATRASAHASANRTPRAAGQLG